MVSSRPAHRRPKSYGGWRCSGRKTATEARFGNANEHADWETAHHVFTYANAVHQMLRRIGTANIDTHVTTI